MNNEALVTSIISFSKLLNQSSSEAVKHWDMEFIQQSIDRCVFIETELSLLQTQERKELQSRAAHDQSGCIIPSLDELLHALHEFLKRLLQNVFLSNDVYLYILKNYRFLTVPDEEDMLLKDLTELAQQAAASNILREMLEELSKTQ